MGHTHDAVTAWNDLFSKLGEEDGKKAARIWMKFPSTYELQFGTQNSSAGGALSHKKNGRYCLPETDADKIAAFKSKKENQSEIDKIIKEVPKLWWIKEDDRQEMKIF